MTDYSPPWTWSEQHDNVFEAYIAALNAELRVVRDSTVNTGKYTYRHATLAGTLGAIDAALEKHKVRVTTLPVPGPDAQSWGLVVTLVHESGEWMAFPPYVRPLVKDEQGHGSAVTYGRRYALTAIFSLLADDDDDGKAATDLVRNVEQLKGSRTEQELAIRTIMASLPEERTVLIGGEMTAAFGSKLNDLATRKHADALAWLIQRVNQPDPEPEPPELPDTHHPGDQA